jgi:hypothetical protein
VSDMQQAVRQIADELDRVSRRGDPVNLGEYLRETADRLRRIADGAVSYPGEPYTSPRYAGVGASRTRVRQPVGPCPCACNSGGFCGGCGHAGCGGRR